MGVLLSSRQRVTRLLTRCGSKRLRNDSAATAGQLRSRSCLCHANSRASHPRNSLEYPPRETLFTLLISSPYPYNITHKYQSIMTPKKKCFRERNNSRQGSPPLNPLFYPSSRPSNSHCMIEFKDSYEHHVANIAHLMCVLSTSSSLRPRETRRYCTSKTRYRRRMQRRRRLQT